MSQAVKVTIESNLPGGPYMVVTREDISRLEFDPGTYSTPCQYYLLTRDGQKHRIDPKSFDKLEKFLCEPQNDVLQK